MTAIRTGNRHYTIPNPVDLDIAGDRYEGPVDGFVFAHQQANFNALSAIMHANGRKFHTVHAIKYPVRARWRRGSITTFVVEGDDVVWYKYGGGSTPASGQNYFYIKGHKSQTTRVLMTNLIALAHMFNGPIA